MVYRYTRQVYNSYLNIKEHTGTTRPRVLGAEQIIQNTTYKTRTRRKKEGRCPQKNLPTARVAGPAHAAQR
jgi:hypothetical protein